MNTQHPHVRLDEFTNLLSRKGYDELAQAFAVLATELGKLVESRELHETVHSTPPQSVRTRQGRIALAFPSVLDKGRRSERAFKLAMVETFVRGHSSASSTSIAARLCDSQVDGAGVAEVAAALDSELEVWRRRELGVTPYVMLDCFRQMVRRRGTMSPCVVLTAVGIDERGNRTVLGVEVSSGVDPVWAEFLSGLRCRGLRGVKLVVSDEFVGLESAVSTTFPAAVIQSCQCCITDAALTLEPDLTRRAALKVDLRSIFAAPDRAEADRRLAKAVQKRMESTPTLANWLATRVPAGFAVYGLPITSRKRLRSSGLLSRLNREVRRRSKAAGPLSDESAALRIATAMMMEASEDWANGRRYLAV
jgi:putative transposase